MGEWKEYKLGELFLESNQGVNTTTEKVKYSESGFRIIRAKNIFEYKIDFEDVVHVTEETFINLKDPVKPKLGDVLFTNIGSQLGSAAIVKNSIPFAIAWNVFRISSNKSLLDSLFLMYFLNNPETKNFIRNLDSSSTMPFVSGGVIKSLEFTFPPLSEQTAIAAVLSSLDDKIDMLHRQNATLEKLAETLFRKWFVEEAKEDWEEVDMSFITKRITDGAHYSPATTEVGMPMASVKDMYNWGINIESCRKISNSDYNELVQNDCRPLKDDIIIAKDGSYLKHVFVAQENLDVVILSSIAILRPNGKYHPLLLATFLKLDSTIEQLENIVTGAVIPRIVLKDFRKFKVQLPPLDIQNRALEFIEPIYKKCWKNINQIQTLTKLRDTLLPKLMSGEVRMK